MFFEGLNLCKNNPFLRIIFRNLSKLIIRFTMVQNIIFSKKLIKIYSIASQGEMIQIND